MYHNKLHFHFTGIGGSGMSGIAEVLLNLGYQVSGSDVKDSPVCLRLRNQGAQISIGHATANLAPDASLLVYSSAIDPRNPEIIEARARKIPVIPRAEVLAELMRLKHGIAVAGSHGKTSTTSMIASILEAGKKDPTVIVGGKVKTMSSGAKVGHGDFLVAESDESDKSFLLLRPTIAVVTNIDEEHLSTYGSMKELEEAFFVFMSSVPFYGLSIFCIDDPKVLELYQRYPKRKVSYGTSPDADIRAINIEYSEGTSRYDVLLNGRVFLRASLPMPGEHFVVNSLAAVAVGVELGLSADEVQEGLESFGGVSRRIEILSTNRGITVISDYGHHPTEIRATLKAVRSGWKQSLRKMHVVFQPHRYSRTRDCFDEFLLAFKDSDSLYIAPIYSAGESPLAGISSEELVAKMQHPACSLLADLNDIHPTLRACVQTGDVIIFLGAGSVGAAAEEFAENLDIPSL